MRRVLVPLDGTKLSAAIIPDAIRLAGTGGEILLLVDVGQVARMASDRHPDVSHWNDSTDEYLRPYLAEAHSQGVQAVTHKLWTFDASWVISDMADYLKADMIACATHGRTPLGRLVRGATAWYVVAHSRVPVLLRHVEPERLVAPTAILPRIMVPLDGSAYAEKALPLAVTLARERRAELALVRVATAPITDWGAANMSGWSIGPIAYADEVVADECYLTQVAASLPIETKTYVLEGSPIAGALADFVHAQSVTDVVMTTHGRTGLSRVIIGSVADSLVHELSCPILLVPALAAARVTVRPAERVPEKAEEESRTPAGVGR